MTTTKSVKELGNRLLKLFAPECKRKIDQLYTDKYEEYLVLRIADEWDLDYKTEVPGKFSFDREFRQKRKNAGAAFKTKLALFYFAKKYGWNGKELRYEYFPILRRESEDGSGWWERFEDELKLEAYEQRGRKLSAKEKDVKINELEAVNRRTNDIIKLLLEQKENMRIGKDVMDRIKNLENQKKFCEADALILKLQEDEEAALAAKYHQRAGLHKILNKFSEALDFYSKAIALQPENENYLSDKATLLIELGMNKEGKDLLEACLKIFIGKYGELNKDVAALYNSLGYVTHNTGSYDDSLNFYTKAKDIYTILFGERHPRISLVYNNLGALFKVRGDLKSAMDYFKLALEIDEEKLGVDHENLAYRYNNIGVISEMSKNFSEALLYYDKTMRILRHNFGELHPQIASCNINIASVQRYLGDFGKAHHTIDVAIRQFNLLYKIDHPQKALCQFELGLIYEAEERFSEALVAYEKALDIDQKCNDDTHPVIARDYKGMASAYAGLKKWDHAIKCADNSLRIFLKRPETMKQIIDEVKAMLHSYKKQLTRSIKRGDKN